MRLMSKSTSIAMGTAFQPNVGRSSKFAGHAKLNVIGLCRFGGQLDSVLESTEQSGQLHLFTSAGS